MLTSFDNQSLVGSLSGTYSKTQTLLKCENVSLVLGEEKKLILRDINLEIKDIIRPGYQQGQVISLLAPSGTGKTQLLKILGGLQPATTGTVLVGSQQLPVQEGEMGFVQQTYPLFKRRTVLENLELAARNLPKAEAKEKIDYYLNEFNILDKKKFYPAQLSGGQKQRVSIAMQLLCSGHFLLMDEPFSGLDIMMIDKVSEFINKVAQLHEENTIIIVSHDITSTCAISDTVWLMGFEKDANGVNIPGATIRKEYDLIQEGLAWRKNIRDLPAFQNFVRSVRSEYSNLC